MTTIKEWWGFELPFRKCDGTYRLYSAETMPDLFGMTNPYENIKTLNDLSAKLEEIDEKWKSPTASYFEIDTSEGIFYLDQQGCVIWKLNDKGQVMTTYGQLVAEDLPEFLYRMDIENSIFYKYYFSNKFISYNNISNDDEFEGWVANFKFTNDERKYLYSLYNYMQSQNEEDIDSSNE